MIESVYSLADQQFEDLIPKKKNRKQKQPKKVLQEPQVELGFQRPQQEEKVGQPQNLTVRNPHQESRNHSEADKLGLNDHLLPAVPHEKQQLEVGLPRPQQDEEMRQPQNLTVRRPHQESRDHSEAGKLCSSDHLLPTVPQKNNHVNRPDDHLSAGPMELNDEVVANVQKPHDHSLIGPQQPVVQGQNHPLLAEQRNNSLRGPQQRHNYTFPSRQKPRNHTIPYSTTTHNYIPTLPQNHPTAQVQTHNHPLTQPHNHPPVQPHNHTSAQPRNHTTALPQQPVHPSNLRQILSCDAQQFWNYNSMSRPQSYRNIHYNLQPQWNYHGPQNFTPRPINPNFARPHLLQNAQNIVPQTIPNSQHTDLRQQSFSQPHQRMDQCEPQQMPQHEFIQANNRSEPQQQNIHKQRKPQDSQPRTEPQDSHLRTEPQQESEPQKSTRPQSVDVGQNPILQEPQMYQNTTRPQNVSNHLPIRPPPSRNHNSSRPKPTKTNFSCKTTFISN